MATLTNRTLAQSLLDNPTKQHITKIAEYLVATGRAQKTNSIINTVEELASNSGTVVAHVYTARNLSDIQASVVSAVKNNTKADTVEIVLHNDPNIIGGCKIITSNLEIDTSIQTQLRSLS